MTEAIPVTQSVIAKVKGIIPDDVIARWKEKGEIVIEDDKNDN
jgi:hypothetical protein